MYIYICIHLYMYMYMHMYMCIYMYTIYICIYVCIYTHVYRATACAIYKLLRDRGSISRIEVWFVVSSCSSCVAKRGELLATSV